MFTGIVEGTGRVCSVVKGGGGLRLEVEVSFDLGDTNVGDSISFNGCCLTLTSKLGRHIWADLSAETVATTTLGCLRVGNIVNLERAMPANGRLGGHLVQGHVDGMAEVVSISKLGKSKKIRLKISSNLSRYIVDKGAVAVDGVSLTVNCVDGDFFEITVIPHTSLVTTFSRLKVRDLVNLEVDIVGKYVEKLGFLNSNDLKEEPEVTEEFLKKHGFMK